VDRPEARIIIIRLARRCNYSSLPAPALPAPTWPACTLPHRSCRPGLAARTGEHRRHQRSDPMDAGARRQAQLGGQTRVPQVQARRFGMNMALNSIYGFQIAVPDMRFFRKKCPLPASGERALVGAFSKTRFGGRIDFYESRSFSVRAKSGMEVSIGRTVSVCHHRRHAGRETNDSHLHF
jgi:hypothetical protein